MFIEREEREREERWKRKTKLNSHKKIYRGKKELSDGSTVRGLENVCGFECE